MKNIDQIFENNKRYQGTYSFTDLSHLGRTEFISRPRFYTSFKQMADEDAMSRIPLGVHFRMDCTEGVRLGELAAKRVLELPWKKSNYLADLAQQPIISVENTLNDIRIYPNPASDYIEVDLKQYEGKEATLYIYNQVGKIVQMQQIERASATPVHLDMNRQTSGQMLLRVTAEGRREVTQKFVIQN